MSEQQDLVFFGGNEPIEHRVAESQRMPTFRGRALDGPAVSEAGFVPNAAQLAQLEADVKAEWFGDVCECNHERATHTYHGTGCWHEEVNEEDGQLYCACEEFRVRA